MPRITRIHFAGLGHKDARFPALTLDLRNASGHAVDSVIWAENSTGKSSLLSLFFSTYRPSQRLFLGKQAESKARELGDYLRDRDLGFVVTEWDVTDDRAEASLLADGPLEVLIVGQSLSWRGLDKSTGDLRRRFFTLRQGRGVNFDTLPILGLGEPVSSFEAFGDWLDAQQKAQPRLAVVHTTNQTEWKEHLESNHLDPELFTFQLRMNEREGGINNLFNELKRDADFIHEFLKLGFDPATATEVRKNLDAFLPKLRRRATLDLQLEFNQKLLVDLGLFVQQMAMWESAEKSGEAAEQAAGALMSALIGAKEQFAAEVTRLETQLNELDGKKTQLESARTTNGRRQNFFRRLKAQLELSEAETRLKDSERIRGNALLEKRLIEMAVLLGEIRGLAAEVSELERALERERTQAKPVLESLCKLGAAYKFQLDAAASGVKASQSSVEEQRSMLRQSLKTLNGQRTDLVTEKATKQQELSSLEGHFGERDSYRERLRKNGWLEAKEAASDALARWNAIAKTSKESEQRAGQEVTNLRAEQNRLTTEASTLAADVAAAQGRVNQLAAQVQAAEAEEERLATNEQMRAAVEAPRADLNLPQTGERLSDRAAMLFRQILRLNVEGAENERAQASVDKQRLFPPHPDIESLVEKLQGAGFRSATTAAQWLAYNFANPQAAADWLTDNPAQISGVMFDEATDGLRLREALSALRTEQLPVVVAPIPNTVEKPPLRDKPGTDSPLVVLPRHAAGFNFAAAQVEAQKLTGTMIACAKELETLNAQLDSTKTLLSDLAKWLDGFGGKKLGALREILRGEQQSFVSLQERCQKNSERRQEVSDALTVAATAEQQAREQFQRSEKAVNQLTGFIERFDVDYDFKRSRQTELAARLQAISVELPSIEEEYRKLEGGEKPLEARMLELGVDLASLQKESAGVSYAGELPATVIESLEQLRVRYATETQQYEGRFLNTKAQGELAAKQAAMRNKERKITNEFSGVDRAKAESKLGAGDLPGQMQAAEAALANAQREEGAADLQLKAARQHVKQLGAAGEQERPGQVELIPSTSVEAANELGKLESEASQIQQQSEANRSAIQTATESKNRFAQRVIEYNNHANRLHDKKAPVEISPTELPEDDPRVSTMTEDALRHLDKTRGETESEHEKLRAIHSRIYDLTQEERFARATDLPARSLFVHMPLEELILSAADKQRAVQEETLVLEADLAQMNQHRETLVESLLSVCEQAARLLTRAEKWSVLPENMGEWAGEPFLRIRLRLSPNRADNLARLKSLVDLMFTEGKIPPAIELVFRGLMALVGETGVDATILKPETQRRRNRYPVREMGGWSEGERTTVAILLYCTLVKIRTQSRGHAARRTEVSALLLDNPVGPCSKPEFLQMHRWIAAQLGVQLIYATGINDPAALSVFPNRVRLAKNRFIPATGELAVGLQTDSDESVIQDIRIFDGSGETDGRPRETTET